MRNIENRIMNEDLKSAIFYIIKTEEQKRYEWTLEFVK